MLRLMLRTILLVALGGLGSLSDPAVRAQEVKERAILEAHKHPIKGLTFTADGKTLISCSGDKEKGGEILIWDLAKGKVRLALEQEVPVNCVAVAPNGKTWSAGYHGNHAIALYDVATGKLTSRLEYNAFFSPSYSMAFSLDGKSLAVGNGGDVFVWDVSTRKHRWNKSVAGLGGEVPSLTWSRDGKTLALATLAQEVLLWDATTGKKRSSLVGHEGAVIAVAYSPDGKTLASGCTDKTVKLWNVDKEKVQGTLEGQNSIVVSLAFSPDSKTLASASVDAKVRLWSTVSGKELAVIDKADIDPRGLAFSPDGKTLAVGCKDKTIKLWNVEAITKPMK